MYRLVLYDLIVLILVAIGLSSLGILPYTYQSIIFSAAFLTTVSWITNKIFSRVFNAPTNFESVYITALILTLIISPLTSVSDVVFLAWAAILATASKYIFAIGKKHLFNPAGIAVVLTAFVAGQSASWWTGTAVMMPFVVIGGLLVVRKIRRADMVFSFFITAVITILGFTALRGGDVINAMVFILLHSPIFFFAFIMFTEPLTTPPTKILQVIYGTFVGFLFAPQVHLGNIYSTPELALVVGNIFSYLVSPKEKLLLNLKGKIQVAPDVYDFLFAPSKIPSFRPGQYMEWTLPHPHPDGRGNRRYFTIASSPTENVLRLGIKFYPNSSSFKKAILKLDNKTTIVGSQRAGDFTLPKDKRKKLVFIAGGIGITPFRSILKYLLDKKEKRTITIFYSNKSVSEIVYKDVLDEAKSELGVNVVYTLTDKNSISSNWQGKTGRIDAPMIKSEVPDYMERTFYISGPYNMVTYFKEMLLQMGIQKGRVVTDYFPGLV